MLVTGQGGGGSDLGIPEQALPQPASRPVQTVQYSVLNLVQCSFVCIAWQAAQHLLHLSPESVACTSQALASMLAPPTFVGECPSLLMLHLMKCAWLGGHLKGMG